MMLVGMHLDVGCAVFAVVRPAPLRLIAVAEVTLPASAPTLVRTRRQLHLPRWSPIALTAEPGSAAAAYAVLLARAGLPVAWMPALDAAEKLWSASGVRLDGAFQALTGDRAVALAAGAAVAAQPVAPIDVEEYVDEADDGRGWSVQRLDASAPPAVDAPADQGRTR